MNSDLRCVVDFGRRFVRVVVCDPTGHFELEKHTWEKTELADRLLVVVQEAEQQYGLPLRVTGRTDAPWPDSLLADLWNAGVAVDLVGGPWLRDMLRLARAHREDTQFDMACFLGACAAAQATRTDLDTMWPFVVNWYIQRNRDRRLLLDLELPFGRPSEWLEDESLCYLTSLVEPIGAKQDAAVRSDGLPAAREPRGGSHTPVGDGHAPAH